MNKQELFEKVYGCLMGGLIGDAFGAPVEGMHYKDIAEKHGTVNTFSGSGTDDSAVKLILCRALLKYDGHITADEFAESFMENPEFYNLFFIPVCNMFHKVKDKIALPIDAGYGNMQSSSSAMAISPMGIVNAANPRQAAMEAFEVAGLIHSGPTSFCRDGAAAIAAATAEAMRPNTTIESILSSATSYLHKTSSELMINKIKNGLQMAKDEKTYEAFRERYYNECLFDIICDSRETIPLALALFMLAGGDPEQTIVYAANFGRDADTVASMAGAIAGAYRGISGFPAEWIAKIESENSTQKQLAVDMTDLAVKRIEESENYSSFFSSILSVDRK